jgi:prepilin-type N-terminal cleavage/methylation domain-containing protein
MKNSSRAGFTILEVLIATVVLAIGLTAMMGMQIAYVNGSNSAKDTQMATAIAQSIAEQLKSEAATWTRNRSPQLDSTRHRRLKRLVDAPNTYHNVFGGRPVNPNVLPLHEDNEDYVDSSRVNDRARVGARYCIDVQGRKLTDTVIVGQVRVSWATDGTSPWQQNNGKCAPSGDNSESFLVLNGVRRPGRRSVMVPFTVTQHMYAGEDGQ